MTNYTADQLALKAHLEAENAAWVAKCEAHGSTFYTTTTEDLDHWARCDVYSVEDYERHALISEISDASKAAYGFRLRMGWDAMSLEELREQASAVWQDASRAAEEEKSREEEDVEDFKKLIEDTIALGAGDEETALRWLVQDEDFDYSRDLEGWVYDHGILFTDYGREVAKKLTDIVNLEY